MSAILRIYESELDVVAAEIRAWPDTETGGSLYGLWSVGGSPTVMLACRPGPGAVHQEAYFHQDPETHMALERALWEQHGVQCVGLWHSHHRIGLPHLSPGDVERTRTYARNHKRERYTEILGWFDGHDQVSLRPYVYERASEAAAFDARVQVLPGQSPLRGALRVLSRQRQLAAALRPATTQRYALHRSSADDVAHHTRAARVLAALGDALGAAVPPPLHDGLQVSTEEDERVILRLSGPGERAWLRLVLTWEGGVAVDRWEVGAHGRLVCAAAPSGARRRDVHGFLTHGVRVLSSLHPGA